MVYTGVTYADYFRVIKLFENWNDLDCLYVFVRRNVERVSWYIGVPHSCICSMCLRYSPPFSVLQYKFFWCGIIFFLCLWYIGGDV